MLHSVCQEIWKTEQWPQWNRSVFISIPKKDNAKECSNYHTVVLISHGSEVMFKILQVRLQQYLNWEIPEVQAGFRKGRGTRGQIASIHWIIEKVRKFQKNIYFCFIDHTKAFVWITINCGKFLKMMQLKCCTQYVSKFGKLSSGHRTGKGLFSFQSQRKAMPKNVQITT